MANPDGMSSLYSRSKPVKLKDAGLVGYIAKNEDNPMDAIFGSDYWEAFRIKDGSAQHFGSSPGKTGAQLMVINDYRERQEKA